MTQERNYARRYSNEYDWKAKTFYTLFRDIIVKSVAKIFYGLKIEGEENLPPKNSGKYIFAGNHISILDPPFLAVAVAKHSCVSFMAKKELFNPKERFFWLIKKLGAFSVNREKPEIATFKTVRDILNTDWSLGIFPQGGIRPTDKIEDLQKGFAVIAKNAKADIIPVAHCNWTGYTNIPFSKNITMKIGTPISHELSVEEIMYEWANQICEATGAKNLVPKP